MTVQISRLWQKYKSARKLSIKKCFRQGPLGIINCCCCKMHTRSTMRSSRKIMVIFQVVLKSSIYSKVGKILSFDFDIVSVLKIYLWISTFMWDMFHYSHFNNYQSLAACSKPSWLNQNVSYFCGCIQKFN